MGAERGVFGRSEQEVMDGAARTTRTDRGAVVCGGGVRETSQARIDALREERCHAEERSISLSQRVVRGDSAYHRRSSFSYGYPPKAVGLRDAKGFRPFPPITPHR